MTVKSDAVTLRDRWAVLPLWAFYMFSALLGGLLYGLIQSLSEPGVQKPIVAGAVFGVLSAALTTGLMRRARKSAGLAGRPAADNAVLNHAIRTGEPPADPALHPALRQLMEYRLVQIRGLRKVNPITFGLLTVLTLITAFDQPVFLAGVVLFPLLGVLSARSAKRTQARIAVLDEALSQ